jgi:hypothetical protein
MKNFVSANAKFYKHSNASGEMGHVSRLFHENVNSFPEYTQSNFGSNFDLYKKYNEIHQRRIKIINKKLRIDTNTFIDCVVSFSLAKWEELENKHGNLNLEKAMKIMMNKFMVEIHNQHHLFPVGYSYHLDEGHIKQYKAFQNQQERIKKGLLKEGEKIIEKESLTRNIHAHAIFYNFDFKTKTSPLRKFTKKTWRNFQDIAGNSFSKGGFIRGISKDLTKKPHTEKLNFVKEKLKSQKIQLNTIELDIKNKEAELLHLESEITENKTHLETLKADVKDLFLKFKLGISKYARGLLKLDLNALDENIEQLQKTVDKTSKVQIASAKQMVEETHAISEKYKRTGASKKLKL